MARRATREATEFSLLPGLTISLPVCEIMNEEQVRCIDEAPMSALENVGIVFRNPIALEGWRKAGADGDGKSIVGWAANGSSRSQAVLPAERSVVRFLRN